MRRFYIIILGVFLILTVNAKFNQEKQSNLVIRAEVMGNRDGETVFRSYTQSEKISGVLNHLRRLMPYIPAKENPELLPGESYTIILHFWDGRQRIYRQHANEYLSVDNEIWRHIDQEQAAQLYPYLEKTQSDL